MTRSASRRVAAVLAGATMALLSQAAAAQGVAWVSSEKDNALTLIDMDKISVIGSVKTCKRPRHFPLTPDGKQLRETGSASRKASVYRVA